MPLKVSSGIGSWIKDFKKSDAPQFKGKSSKERRDMAIAAYLSKKNENVRTADRRPEVYTKPDGKKGVRMVPVDKEVVKEGTWALPDSPKAKAELKKLMSKPMKLGKEGEDATRVMYNLIGDDELFDALYLAGKKNPNGDARPVITKWMKKNLKGSWAKYAIESIAVKEDTSFEVNIEGLPMMFMSGMGPGQIKAKLRKIVKQPSMIQSVKRVTDADVKKTFRLKAQGRDEEEDQVDESSYEKLNKYYKDAQYSKKRATNSAVATILRKDGDHSKDLNTMRKREKGLKMVKSRITDKIRKGHKK